MKKLFWITQIFKKYSEVHLKLLYEVKILNYSFD